MPPDVVYVVIEVGSFGESLQLHWPRPSMLDTPQQGFGETSPVSVIQGWNKDASTLLNASSLKMLLVFEQKIFRFICADAFGTGVLAEKCGPYEVDTVKQKVYQLIENPGPGPDDNPNLHLPPNSNTKWQW